MATPMQYGAVAAVVMSAALLWDLTTVESVHGQTPLGIWTMKFAVGNGERLMFIADVMHHPIQCRELDWSTCFCADPAQAAATRRELFAEIADRNVIVFPEHVPFPTAGHIESDGERFRYRFISPWRRAAEAETS